MKMDCKTLTRNLFLLLLPFFLIAVDASAQDKPDASKLPDYIVVSSMNRVAIAGGIMVNIDLTQAHDGDELQKLANYLSTKKSGNKVVNWTDLLNKMAEFGYEYVDAVVTRQDVANLREIEDGVDALVGGHGEFDHNIIFRKMK